MKTFNQIVDGVDCEVSKEQRKIYDAQTKSFMKDRKQMGKDKMSPPRMQEAKEHDDTEEDEKLIKKMVKPEALKKEEVMSTKESMSFKEFAAGLDEVTNPFTKHKRQTANKLKYQEHAKAGYKAANSGKKTNDNPHKAGTHEYKHWDAGFTNASAGRSFHESVEIEEANLDQLKKQLAQHKKEFNQYASVGGPPRSHPVHDKIKKVNKEIAAAKVNGAHFNESEVDEACWDSHKQIGMKMKNGKKVPNCVPKESVEEIDEARMKLNKGKFEVHHGNSVVASYGTREDAQAHVSKLNESSEAEVSQLKADVKRTGKSHGQLAKELHSHAEDMYSVGRKHLALRSKAIAKQHEELAKQANESVFDWKKTKSEIDWKSDDKKPEQSKEGGTVYKARDKERNAETGGDAPKKSVGRPQGDYGSYKIDKATRDDPKYKSELSKKVMASKAEGFKDREQWKHSMHAEIMKKQLQSAGLNPDDHKDAIAKKNPVKLKN